MVGKPPELPVFGEAGPGKITVKVTGDVYCQGIYYLSDHAVISDAWEAAGRTRLFYPPAIRLFRPVAGQNNEEIRFRKGDEHKPLKDGDWLFLGTEAY